MGRTIPLKLFSTLLAVLLYVCISAAAWADTYYVSTTGNDANTGARTKPWRTIQKAARIAEAGDTVIVAAGKYAGRVNLTRSGKHGSPIIFQARGRVVTQGFTLMANHARIDGFEITTKSAQEEDGAGVYLMGSGNEVLNNYIHDLYFEGILFRTNSPDKSTGTEGNLVRGNRIVRARTAGIHIEGRKNSVDENYISHTLQYPKGAPPIGGADADGIRFFGVGHLISRNSIRDILLRDRGNHEPHIDCFQTWGPAVNIVFHGNYCDNPNAGQQGWMVHGSGIHHLTIRNNVVRAFRLMNIYSAPWLTVVNNSFKGDLSYPNTSERGYGIELHNSPNARVQNNLFYDIGGHRSPYVEPRDQTSKRGLVAGYNAAYMSDGKPPAGPRRAKDVWQKNPRAVDPKRLDFRLKSDSPLIDAGITLTNVKQDRKGAPRPQGKRHDIGAYEEKA